MTLTTAVHGAIELGERTIAREAWFDEETGELSRFIILPENEYAYIQYAGSREDLWTPTVEDLSARDWNTAGTWEER